MGRCDDTALSRIWHLQHLTRHAGGDTLSWAVLREDSYTGPAPPNTLSFAPPVKSFYNATWWKAPLHEPDIPFLMPDGLDVDFSAGEENIISLIDPELLRSACPDKRVERVASASCGHVLPAYDEAMRWPGGMIGSLLDTAQNQPEILQQRAALQEMEQCSLDGFVQTIPAMMPEPNVEDEMTTARPGAGNRILRTENPAALSLSQSCVSRLT